MRHEATVMGLVLLAGAVAAFAIEPLRPAPRDTAAPAAPDTGLAALTPAVPGGAADGPPAVVWWRGSGDKESEPYVSARPGGPALPGRWNPRYFCGHDTRPSGLRCGGEAASPGDLDYGGYSLVTVRDGVNWWYFANTSSKGAASADDERLIVGRWRHDDGRSVIELDLQRGGEGRGSDESVWTWLSAERGLELSRQIGERSVRVTTCVLDQDLRRYVGWHDEKIVGTRVAPALNRK